MDKGKSQLMAIDRGNSGDKIRCESGEFYIPAAISLAQDVVVNGQFLPIQTSRNQLDNLMVVVNGRPYKVGSSALNSVRYQTTVGMSRYNMPNYTEVLLHGSLAATNASGDLTIVTGLPVDDYNDKNKRIVERSFKGSHEIQIPRARGKPKTLTSIVNQVHIMPEPLGSYFDLMIQDDLTLNTDLSRQTVGIIDIGKFTACLLTTKQGKFDPLASQSTPHAMQEIYNQFSALVQSAYQYRIPSGDLEKAFDYGEIYSAKGHLDLSAQRSTAIEMVASEFISEVGQLWQDARDYGKILITGGAAMLFKPYIALRYPQAQIAKNSLFANARGMYKWVTLKS